jgi:hypothetical protein
VCVCVCVCVCVSVRCLCVCVCVACCVCCVWRVLVGSGFGWSWEGHGLTERHPPTAECMGGAAGRTGGEGSDEDDRAHRTRCCPVGCSPFPPPPPVFVCCPRSWSASFGWFAFVTGCFVRRPSRDRRDPRARDRPTRLCLQPPERDAARRRTKQATAFSQAARHRHRRKRRRRGRC